MVYPGENDQYYVRLAGSLLRACENGTADFLCPSGVPYYTQDMITNKALTGAAQLHTLLNNAAHGNQYINYAPTYIFQDSKTEWMKKIGRNNREIGCIIYKGRDENGNKHYEMMSPAGKFNPAGINESPMTQNPVPDIGIFRQQPSFDPRDPRGIEKYITDVIGNYFNAAFTKTPYYAPQWGAPQNEMLSKAINADPSIALRAAQQAYARATSVKMENAVNPELNDNVREAIKQGLPPFNTKKQNTIIGPVNVNGNGIPADGVDFINSYYKTINEKRGAVKSNAALAQNGYIPYQTHYENPKNIDRFLVEEYSNIINASLTGTPYSGSVTPTRLKTLSAGLEAKMENNPAYMSWIVNQAQQNVLGFNYMPYDKDNFINKAMDPSSREFRLLDQMIANHVYDICKRNKQSFNGEFQELSRDLTEKLKNTDTAKPARTPSTRTPSTRTHSPGASAAKKKEMPSAGTSTEIQGERHSFIRQVGEFVRKNVVERSHALILADTFLGAVIDKAKKIFYTRKNIAASFAIASKVVAPNLQMTVTAQLGKAPAANTVTANVNHNDNKSAVRGTSKPGTVKPEEHVQQKQQTRTTARTQTQRTKSR